MAMIQPQLAPVRPRVTFSDSTDAVLLEDEVLTRIERGQWGPIKLLAAAGCGKTTALEHLAAVLGPDALEPNGPVMLVDEPDKDDAERIFAARASRVIVYSGTRDLVPRDATLFRLASWGLDECIEFLLAMHKERCASVMARLEAATDRRMLAGVPELCRVVLDRMAADETLEDCRAALRAEVYSRLPDEHLLVAAQALCLPAPVHDDVEHRAPDRGLVERLRAAGVHTLLRHEVTRVVLAADRLVENLRRRAGKHLARRLPRALVKETASLVRNDDAAIGFLKDVIRGRNRDWHAMAGSLLWAADISWKPTSHRGPSLAGAYLPNIAWPAIRLVKANLCHADFSGANLNEVDLELATVSFADFTGARLHGARLSRLQAGSAKFTGADLSFARAADAVFTQADLSGANLEGALLIHCLLGANLSGTRLVRANLRGAELMAAQIECADFTGADLTDARLDNLDLRSVVLQGACLNKAHLRGCNLEDVALRGAQLAEAHLRGALLTGSSMHDGNFRGANLQNTGLADIQWERADLRDADFRGATFHLGSSRSGLVGSPIACEGSRTGFYTDEYYEQEFKAPEEIRKANLCGADLRGARIDNVDFYLVDLRGARYTPDQEQHLRQCRAILHARV